VHPFIRFETALSTHKENVQRYKIIRKMHYDPIVIATRDDERKRKVTKNKDIERLREESLPLPFGLLSSSNDNG